MRGTVAWAANPATYPVHLHPPPMTLYEAIRAAIDEATSEDEEMSLPELIGTLELIKAELIAAALEPDDEDDEE